MCFGHTLGDKYVKVSHLKKRKKNESQITSPQIIKSEKVFFCK